MYVANELPHYISELKKDNTNNADVKRRISSYNSMILDLLPNLTEEHAEALLRSSDSLIVFTVFKDLFGRGKDYDVWKRKAVEIIHGEIEQEKSRGSSSDKLISYEKILSDLLDSNARNKRFTHQEEREDFDDSDNKFLAEEISYIIGIDPADDRAIIITHGNLGDLSGIFDNLAESARLTFAKRQVLGSDVDGKRRFRVGNHMSFAQKVVQEFPNEEVSKRLKRLIYVEKLAQAIREHEALIEKQEAEERKKISEVEDQIIVNFMKES